MKLLFSTFWHMFSCEICEIFKNIFSIEHLQWLLLNFNEAGSQVLERLHYMLNILHKVNGNSLKVVCPREVTLTLLYLNCVLLVQSKFVLCRCEGWNQYVIHHQPSLIMLGSAFHIMRQMLLDITGDHVDKSMSFLSLWMPQV